MERMRQGTRANKEIGRREINLPEISEERIFEKIVHRGMITRAVNTIQRENTTPHEL